jgi:uncharacterized membrane protein YbhN (UPF0104 family)
MQEHNQVPETLNISASSTPLITVMQVSRTVFCYGITDEELSSVGLLNSISTLCISLGSIFLTLFAERFIECLERGDLLVLLKGPSIILFILFLACGLVLITSLKNRTSIIERIKKQSNMK